MPGLDPASIEKKRRAKARRFCCDASVTTDVERWAEVDFVAQELIRSTSTPWPLASTIATMSGQRLTVWYNTRCPVCDGGIDWQRSKLVAAVRAGHVAFKDINEQPDALAGYATSLDDVRRRLHATDETGRLIVGADVAIAIWRITPGEGWLAALFGNGLMLPLTRFCYDRFADLLFAWNKRRGRW
jgi:predicted DCC family thiol-disulfide oxidoreductase YuxK